MPLIKLLLVGLVYVFNKLSQHYGAKTVWLSATSIILIAFGDVLVPHIAHVLHLMFETVAYGLEHLLQVNFDLTPRQAEMIVAWIAMIALTILIMKLAYKAYISVLVGIEHLKVKAMITKASMEANPKHAALVISAVTFGTLGTTFLLFS